MNCIAHDVIFKCAVCDSVLEWYVCYTRDHIEVEPCSECAKSTVAQPIGFGS